jgi:hypothetical protein
MDSPNTDYLHLGDCLHAGTWRRLTAPVNGVADDWYINNISKRIETRAFPLGVYTGYTRDGLTGTPT